MSTLQTIPARRGKAVRVAKGQSVKIINTHGNQVVDFWAFNAGDLREYMGMEHCHAFWTRLYPVEGDKMVTNRRRAILTLTRDGSPGRHDTLIAPVTTNATAFSAARITMTIAATTCMRGWPSSGFSFPTRLPQSTCS